MNPPSTTPNKSWIGLVILAVIVITIIIVALVLTGKPKTAPADMPAGQTATTDQSGTAATGDANSPTAAAPHTIRTTPGELKDQNSDLVSFSIAPGSTLLKSATATGTIDGTYASGSTISIELADKNYDTTKTITGKVTGTAAKNNVTFTANLDNTGIKKGAGYIIFKSASRGTQVRVAVIFQ